MTKHNYPGLVSKLAAWLVGVLALMAFVLSYSSLQHMAAGHGITGWLSYVWPLLLDFAMVVFSLAILRANLRTEPTWYPWTLAIAFSGVSVLANVLDVTGLGIPPVFVSAGVKALAPVALVLAFELLMGMVRAEIKRGNVQPVVSVSPKPVQAVPVVPPKPEPVVPPVPPDVLPEPEPVKVDIAPVLPGHDDDALTDRQRQVWALVQAGMKPVDIARQLDVSAKTIQREVKALNGRVRQ